MLWGSEQPLDSRGYLRIASDRSSWFLLTEESSIPDDRIYLWFPMRTSEGAEHVRVVVRVVERSRVPDGAMLQVRVEPEVASHPLREIVRLVFDGDVGIVERDSAAEGRDSYPTLDDDDRDSGARGGYEAGDTEAAIRVAERSLTEPLPVEQLTGVSEIRWRSIALIAAASLGGVVTLLLIFRLLVWPFMR